MKKYKQIFNENQGNIFDQVDITVKNMVFEDLRMLVREIDEFAKVLGNTMDGEKVFQRYLTDENWDHIDDRLLYELNKEDEYEADLQDLYKYPKLTDNYRRWVSSFEINGLELEDNDATIKFRAEVTGRWKPLLNDDFENPEFEDEEKEDYIEVEGFFRKLYTGWECVFE